MPTTDLTNQGVLEWLVLREADEEAPEGVEPGVEGTEGKEVGNSQGLLGADGRENPCK